MAVKKLLLEFFEKPRFGALGPFFWFAFIGAHKFLLEPFKLERGEKNFPRAISTKVALKVEKAVNQNESANPL